jgi:POT family proton-dependent oligopeptide transporter
MSNTHAADVRFFGHPRGLATLFFTELFERFSFYGMRALLVLFLTASLAEGGLGVNNKTAGAIYGIYTGAVYLFALPGGWVADRVLGQRNSVWYGGIMIALGHFMMASTLIEMFYLGLLMIALGTGLLKPNISAIVGDLYRDQPDARRDAGFSLFYMGINLGGALAPLVSGTIGETLGYHWGFLTAGVAMLIGLIQYRLTSHHLGEAGLLPKPGVPTEQLRNRVLLSVGVSLLIFAVAAVWTGWIKISADQVANAMGQLMVVCAIGFFGSVLLFGRLDGAEKKRVLVIIVFFLCAALFWAGFEQAATTFNLFARDLTDRSLFGSWFEGHQHPTSWYQTINSLYIILLSPFFAWLWITLGKRHLDPSAPLKFGFGLILLGLGFAVLILASQLIISTGGKVGPQWLLLTYLLHTVGELCLSPIGLSNVTKLAPPRFAGQMMGTWFLGAAMGNLVAGLIGGEIGSDVATMPREFTHMTLIGVGAGGIVLLASPLLRRWMGLIR